MKSAASLDHLRRGGEQRRWNVEAERLGGLQIDHRKESRGLLDGNIAGLGSP